MSAPEQHAPPDSAHAGSERHHVVRHSSEVLHNKSRSFPLASLFLNKQRRDDAAILYALCRLIDDVADEAIVSQRANAQLDRLGAELRRETTPRPLVSQFLEMADRQNLDLVYVFELMEGVRSDLGDVRFQSDGQLLRYCYRVAGTVGLMMCAVLDVDDPRARAHAIDLGIGMQLTNICRDVGEDAERGRIYLPSQRLGDIGITHRQILDADVDEEALAAVIDDLLELADTYYDSADDGMGYIPIRSRLAIIIASRLYRAIGLGLRGGETDVTSASSPLSTPVKVFWLFCAGYSWILISLTAFSDRQEHHRRLHQPLRGLPGVTVP